MRRRQFLAAALAAAAWSRSGLAQQPGHIPRIGILLQVPPSEPTVAPLWKALLDGLREHGWEDGRNLILEGRFGGRNGDGFRKLAPPSARIPKQFSLSAIV